MSTHVFFRILGGTSKF